MTKTKCAPLLKRSHRQFWTKINQSNVQFWKNDMALSSVSRVLTEISSNKNKENWIYDACDVNKNWRAESVPNFCDGRFFSSTEIERQCCRKEEDKKNKSRHLTVVCTTKPCTLHWGMIKKCHSESKRPSGPTSCASVGLCTAVRKSTTADFALLIFCILGSYSLQLHHNWQWIPYTLYPTTQ